MKSNLHIISVIFTILIIFLWLGYMFTLVFSQNQAEIDLSITLVPLLISIFGVGLYNLFAMDSKGDYSALKKDPNITKNEYEYYGLNKRNYCDEEDKFDDLCNILDEKIKTAISNLILMISAVPFLSLFIVAFFQGSIEGIFLNVIAIICIVLTIVGLVWAFVNIIKHSKVNLKEILNEFSLLFKKK